MKIKILTQIFALFLTFGITHLDSADSVPDRKIELFAKAYQAEKSPFKKRSMCIEAIDEGLIARNVSVSVIDRMFGTHFAKDRVDPDGKGMGAVHFSPQPHQDGYNQIAPEGWYLGVTWEKDGAILDYSISNTHK